MSLKVLIVDDHPVFLAGLRSLLEMNQDMEIVGEARDGHQAVELQKQLKPDVVVMDINMPGMNGIEATQTILSENPDANILALSIHSSKRFVKGMLEAGAKGYLLKVAVPEELIMAIQKIAQGDRYLSSTITNIALTIEAGGDEKVNILNTKFHRPQMTKEHVKRSHLLDLLHKNSYKPATLISAGAGYGKSTLISSWLEETKTPYNWVSLSEDDNDLRNFINCLSAAVRKRFPNALEEINDLVELASLPKLELVSEYFINGLDEIDEEFVLVLDDYHHIQNNEINQLISNLLRFPPQLMHLVIITRRDPYLDLSSLRAHSRLNEIRMADLCFRENEINSLFENILNTKLKPDIVQKLLQQTEGWITGLRLASLTVKADEDANEVFKVVNPNSPTTANFLLKEVISNQPEYIRNCLIQISVLDSFCDELIDWLCISQTEKSSSEISGQKVIKTLIDANLFTISLDYEQKWYRFHHLFQDMLQSQLKETRSSEDIKSYHLKAAAWFDKNGLMERAVKHAIKADDINRAVDLVSSYRYELINTEQMHRLSRLLNMIPEKVLEITPQLLTAKSFYMDFLGMIPELVEYKEKAKVIINNEPVDSQEADAIRGEIEVLEGVFYIVFADWKNLVECSERALKLLPEQAKRIMINAIGYQVVGYQMIYGVEKGMEKVKGLLVKYPIQSKFSQVGEQLWHSLVLSMMGDALALKTPALKLLKLSDKNHFVESLVYGKFFVSYAHYLANENELAVPYLISVVNGSFVHRTHYVLNCAFMLASIYIDKGEVENADILMEFALKQTAETGNEAVLVMAKVMQVDLAIKAGNIEKAKQLDENKDFSATMPPMWFPFVPQLIPFKIRIAQNTLQDLLEARKLLAEFEGPIRQANKKAILIDVLLLQALAFKALRNKKDALLKITEAIELSSKGNCLRPFIEFGAPLQNLIAGLSDMVESKAHIDKILEAIKDRGLNFVLNSESKAEKITRPITTNALPEELSFREIEVLQLVAKGLRNKEISDTLYIQTNTVKKHMKNIFSKLNVSNRLKAAKKAEELGIIESE